jgi:uncharacterized phage protein (TIGR01671 family)
MKREVKIKGWHKILKEFVPVHKYVSIDQHGIIGNDYVDVLLFTGLKDKNSKEICEGDILKMEYGNYQVIYHLYLGWDGSGSIHPGFYLARYNEKIDEELLELDYHLGFDESEIIGNIYENPEYF